MLSDFKSYLQLQCCTKGWI